MRDRVGAAVESSASRRSRSVGVTVPPLARWLASVTRVTATSRWRPTRPQYPSRPLYLRRRRPLPRFGTTNSRRAEPAAEPTPEPAAAEEPEVTLDETALIPALEDEPTPDVGAGVSLDVGENAGPEEYVDG